MHVEFSTSDPFPDDEQLEREARDYWFDTLAGVGDVEERVQTFMACYGAAYDLQQFSKSGGCKTREGYDLLGGRKRQSPDDRAGPFGRFVVIVGTRFETSDIDFGLIPELAAFRDSPEAQFDQEIVDIAQEAVEHLLGPYVPYVFVPERGEENGHNHLHVAHRVGACPVGRKTLNTTPQDALRCARYFGKGVTYTPENLCAYVNAVRLQGRPAKRIRYGRLGSRRITCADVGAVLGFSVLRPVKTKRIRRSVGSGRNLIDISLAYRLPDPQALPLLWWLPEPTDLVRVTSTPTLAEKLAADTEEPLQLWSFPRRKPLKRHSPIAVAHWGVSPPQAVYL